MPGRLRQLLGFWHESTFDVPTEFSWGPGLVPPARRTRRRAKAACTEGCARRWSSLAALTSACEQDRPDRSQTTRRAATPANGWSGSCA